MKLTQINVTLKSGSTGRLAYQLHQYATENGAHSRIAFGFGDKTDAAGFSLYSKVGTHLHSFLSRKLCMQGLCSYWQTGRLLRYLKRTDPDVIHLHNIHGHYMHYPRLFRYLQKSKKPVIWTLHDCWAFTGKCAHYSSACCDKWKSGCHSCPNLATYPDSTYDGSRRNYRLKKKWFTCVDNLTIVGNSDWTKKQAEESFLQGKRILRIYNGVDTTVFRPVTDWERVRDKYGIPRDAFVILGVSGVWKKDKGLDTFLDLARTLPDDCVLVMVGLSEQQKAQLPNHIVGITKTESTEELAALYSAADVLLNPSREETFGMVAAEAMACGTPVIVSDTTACPEIVTDKTGLSVDTRDIHAVLAAIGQIKDSGKAAFSPHCLQNVLDNFTTAIMCEKYWELYQSTTGGN